jgi:hypothetical protein
MQTQTRITGIGYRSVANTLVIGEMFRVSINFYESFDEHLLREFSLVDGKLLKVYNVDDEPMPFNEFFEMSDGMMATVNTEVS